MKREEAKEAYGNSEYTDEIIKALEQEPTPDDCETCIHNKDVLECDMYGCKYEPTTKNCESCKYYGSHHEVCNYCYKCSLWTEQEPTTNNDLINSLDDFIAFGKKAFGVELTIKKSDNPDTYEKLFGTTNNNLAVRELEEIVVEYPPENLCTYPEYKGKPYFSIKYKEGNDHIIGYGTYNPKVFSRYLKDYFMSTTNNDLGVDMVEPQESEE